MGTGEITAHPRWLDDAEPAPARFPKINNFYTLYSRLFTISPKSVFFQIIVIIIIFFMDTFQSGITKSKKNSSHIMFLIQEDKENEKNDRTN